MPPPHPPEFRQRAVELARLRDKPIATVAADLGISQSCLRNWVKQASTVGPIRIDKPSFAVPGTRARTSRWPFVP